jgi:hypothetical protein
VTPAERQLKELYYIAILFRAAIRGQASPSPDGRTDDDSSMEVCPGKSNYILAALAAGLPIG